MSQIHIEPGRHRVASRILPLFVVFCLAVSGVGVRLPIASWVAPGSLSQQEEIESSSEVRLVSPRHMRVWQGLLSVQSLRPQLQAAAVERLFPRLPSPMVRLRLLGSGILLLL